MKQVGLTEWAGLRGCGRQMRFAERRFGLIIIIAVPVVPMTVGAPMPVPVRTIIVVIVAIVVRIVATVVYRIRVPIGWSDRYAKVTVSL